MEQDNLRKDIEAIVASIFSEKEEADVRKRTEDALEEAATTIDDLTTALENRHNDVEKLESKVSKHEEKASNLETELEAAQQEVESFKEKLEEAQNALEEMKKDRATDIRMAELEEAGVARNGEEPKTVQVAKVREMSDEEYVSYKDELVAVRQAVLDEIAAASELEDTEEEIVEEKEEVAEEKEEVVEEEEETPSPANVDPDKKIEAALNLDTDISNDFFKKYAELGKAMAENLTK